MSWKTILKASGCGCNDCNEVSKAKGMSASGFKGGSRRKPRYGTTTEKGSCPDRLEQLVDLLLSGRISEDEYKKRKEQWDRDCR